MKQAFRLIAALVLSVLGTPVHADDPQVIAATATASGDNWTIAVTLTHPDTGWDHYADGWRVELPDGTELGFRELLHPHVNEQPFSRSLSGVKIPAGTTMVLIRARCLTDGWSPHTTPLAMTR